ncbi:hypothetical protein K378_02295 [Streptomyces sp. Amel2xB2]|nr:hypothetical protein K378_02295 [Streptomyces sp. Amel2xB2]
MHIDERGPLLTWARATKRNLPVALGYAVGTATEWEATHPRRYTSAVRTTVIRLPQLCLPWHADHGNDLTASPRPRAKPRGHNFGSEPTHPVVELWGPVEPRA